ncbi:alpha/beta-hydrolase [Trematosphaeria pertusa]|uniref:Alpha/beta-hydrolase n=1 Tax=Trematosphaeria pertusa TaxID=390896 RepID=A0A6A6HVM8_9PLEO|nr:alpha/beta-hydrolase [Trematosphaeria pertusa]KAF2242225.1 alpha/beta-hydrolase [Trematosphaeria pertusa]
MGLLTTQPFKGVYALGAFTFELARLPLWLVKYLTSYGRQHPEWSYRQALGVRIFFSAVHHLAAVQAKTPLPHTPGKEKERFIIIKAAEGKYFKGPLVSNEDVKPTDIGGTWYPAPLSASSDLGNVLVVLHIHGGAYVIGDGRTEASGYFAKKVLKHTPATHILCPQYRLSTLPASKTSNPFPAALQDSLTSYLYLLHELKIPAANIVLSGDSAGANNAIALLRYLAEYGAELGVPHPSAALLWSPWVDPSDSSDDYTRTNPNYATDYLPYAFIHWGSTAYAGLGSLDTPYACLKHRDAGFKTPVPLFVNAGSAEILYFDDKEWAEMMRGRGNNVTWDVERNAPHDVLLLGNVLGFDKEAARSAQRAGEWLTGLRK